MLAFPFYNSTAFLCLAHNGPISADGGSGSPRTCASGMFMSLSSRFYETLEKMDAMTVLHDSGFKMPLRYMAYRYTFEVIWQGYTSSWFTHNFNRGEPFAAALRIVS